ncbi:MAG: hypothetical protein ABMA13_00830 [Chthoniobacteraceae bacterium]
MSQPQVPPLAKEFFTNYDAPLKDELWRQQSDAFRNFWSERVMNPTSSVPTDDECDAVIRILDRNGKGNTKKTEAVARAMVPQGAWRRMFAEFKSDKALGALMNSILGEADPAKKAALIDQLYTVNEGKKNNLTGESGNALNAFLAAYDPFKNLSVISLNDRRTLINFLGLTLPFEWDTTSRGHRIVETNRMLFDGLNAAGVAGSARTVSVFCYWQPFKDLWKPNHTTIRGDKKTVAVTVPTKTAPEEQHETDNPEIRESLQVQAMLAEIGSRMGLKIWLPKSDRVRVLTKWKANDGELLDTLPLNYDDLTLRTIEQIDVIWLRKRSIVRAFEVEHTTSIYSGLLRMADLVALQPNMDIKLHIVAPASKREKVFQEISRPVFSLLEGRALSGICTYLTYESVRDLVAAKHLDYLSDSVIEDYAEEAED